LPARSKRHHKHRDRRRDDAATLGVKGETSISGLQANATQLAAHGGADAVAARRPIFDGRILPIAAVAVLIILYVVHFYFIWVNAVDVAFWDEWDFFLPGGLSRKLSVSWLFAPHNEHRVVLTKLEVWLLFRLNDWDTAFHQRLDFVYWGGFISALVICVARRARMGIAAAAVFAVFLLSNTAWQNHSWPGLSTFHFFVTGVLLGCYWLFDPGQRWSRLIAALVAFEVAILSMISGLAFTAVAAVIYAVFKLSRVFSAHGPDRRREWVQCFVVIGLLTMGVLTYFIGYENPNPHAWVPLTSPALWSFWARLVGQGFGFEATVDSQQGHALTLTQANASFIGAACVAIVLAPLVIAAVRYKRHWPDAMWFSAAGVFGILGILGTIAVGRALIGTVASRYAEVGVLLVPLAAVEWASALRGLPRVAVTALILVWMTAAAGHADNWDFRIYREHAQNNRVGRNCVRVMLTHPLGDRLICPAIYPRELGPRLAGARALRPRFIQDLEEENRREGPPNVPITPTWQ
jgi:hypothetical protein